MKITNDLDRCQYKICCVNSQRNVLLCLEFTTFQTTKITLCGVDMFFYYFLNGLQTYVIESKRDYFFQCVKLCNQKYATKNFRKN